jgi:beta-glucosidase-like glycosyl hydrolase
MDLAPVLDAAPRDLEAAALGLRSLSSDPGTVVDDGLAFVHGLEDGGIVPVVKHFPGLGAVQANTDLAPATTPPLAELERRDLVPFRRAVEDGIPVVMVGHPVVPDLSDGLPASLAPTTYDYLRAAIGFDGVAMTDALRAGALSAAGYDVPAAAETALEAGADMVLLNDLDELAVVRGRLLDAVAAGRLPLGRLDTAVGRILTAKHVCPAAAVAATPTGGGLWIVDSDGRIGATGDAVQHGDAAGQVLNRPVVGMAATPSGAGYWLVASDGGVFTFGDARFFGSTGGLALNRPVVGMAATPSATAYLLVTASGALRSFGTVAASDLQGPRPAVRAS